MTRPIKIIAAIGAAITASLSVVAQASAQQAPRTDVQTIPEAIDEIYFSNSGTFFENRTIWRQFSFVAAPAWRSFSESEVEYDAAALELAVQYLQAEQAARDPYLRVPDLRNPYDSSVQLIPSTQSGRPAPGSELIFERLPLP
ncbi:MAG: hypothetical protein AAF651_05160 [Cyanobacteria bacterium P01_C01_bin.73]